MSPAAGIALAAVHIGLDAATVTDGNTGTSGPDRQHLDSQFVPRNPRVLEKRHFSQITADIGAADPHPVGPHQGLAGCGVGGAWDVDVFEMLRFLEPYRTHKSASFSTLPIGDRLDSG